MKTKCYHVFCFWLTIIVSSLAVECSVLTDSNVFSDGKGDNLRYKNNLTT